ncbi:oligosaccharide repeat unit polymerase [Acinetobacter lwoffii]|uniref:O-antigen polymerase n=1 Tax=Acinetobacter lwoffii TaxID=28090 RepID=UPI00209B6096|nr:O-antigen polymerase [Acinetobacter lwoffii]MCO8074283.1 oligosaccharide repeat unit polymerase [Acinetobacter lwoffii]MCO8077234.1 oligosaccharide repeat unit polymerase [Acinetobacter lwoffii]
MDLKKYFIVFLMLGSMGFSILLFQHFIEDIFLSIPILLNFLISFFICLKYAPENHIIKLSSIYLVGFLLFICGRFIYNIFFPDNAFCIEFGFVYCLDNNEKIKSAILINLSLIFFTYGFLNNKYNKIKKNTVFFEANKNTLLIISCIGLFFGLFSLNNSYKLILSAINNGYLSIYSEQDGIYSTPISLIVFTFFVAILAIQYCFKNKYYFCLIFYRLSLFIYLVIMISSIFQGSRSSFISGLIFILWIYLDNKKINLKNIMFGSLILFFMFFANDLASLSGARDASSNKQDIFNIILEDMLYNQGITMMVFNMGVLNNEFPFLAYLKVILPGIQIFYSFFDNINNSHLTFSSFLLYKLEPVTLSQGFGLGWSLLGDFYAFSFGFLPLFLFYNYYWGKIIYRISERCNDSVYYKGLFICFLTQIFMISRSSISILWALIIFYSIFYLLGRLRFKK